MKALIILFFPLSICGQTIHFEEDKIVYEGLVKLQGQSQTTSYLKLQQATSEIEGVKPVKATLTSSQNKVAARTEIQLSSPFHIIRNVQFTLQLTAKENGYVYRIDSVLLVERRRGGDPKVKKGEELLEAREETGVAAIATEGLLNEIDMRFQKMLALLAARMKR